MKGVIASILIILAVVFAITLYTANDVGGTYPTAMQIRATH